MFSQKFTRQLSSGELMREITKHNYEGGEGRRGEGRGGQAGQQRAAQALTGFLYLISLATITNTLNILTMKVQDGNISGVVFVN